MRLMSKITASVMIGATTGLSSMRASAQNYAADGASPVGTFTWTYERGSNRKSSLVYPNGATASWTYDNRGELTSVQNRHADGSAISTYDYTYDAAGRRISKNDERYGYNARSELTQATSISNPNFHAAYQFDDIGNRAMSAEFGIRSGEYTYTANELNQYASIVDENSSDSAAPSDATFTPTYDADGNQTLVKTKTGIWQVTYNAENRPVKWTCGTTNLVMAFDRMGRRVLSEVQVEGTPVKTETYVYDGYTCILRQTTLHTNATPTVVRDTFVWDPTEPVATRPLVWNRVEEKGSSRETHPTAFYFHDGNKNVSDVVSASGEVLAHYTYAPFGDCAATGALAEVNPWRFSSEYADDEIGCVYYNYRHYEPMMGRWLSRDVIEERGCINIYLFSFNQKKFLFIDSLGQNAFDSMMDYIFKEYNDVMAKWGSKSGDKFRHCLLSCILSRKYGILFAEVAGLVKEGCDSIKRIVCGAFPSLRTKEFCQGGHGDFWDSLKDILANQQCVLSLSSISAFYRTFIGQEMTSCEDCCKCKVGQYTNEDHNHSDY